MSKLAYLALCRSIHLLVLLARGDAAKDLEILVLRPNSPCSAAKSHVPGSSRRPRPTRRVQPRPLVLLLVKPETLLRWHRHLVAVAGIYPHHTAGRPQLDQDLQQLIVRLVSENPHGATSASRGSCSGSACASLRPRSAPRYAAAG